MLLHVGLRPIRFHDLPTLLLTSGAHPKHHRHRRSTPTLTSSMCRTTSPELSRTPQAAGLQYGCNKRSGKRILVHSCATLCLQRVAFLKWAMLGSNQRPPPCKGEEGYCRALPYLAESSYLRRFLFPSLHTIARSCAVGDVEVMYVGSSLLRFIGVPVRVPSPLIAAAVFRVMYLTSVTWQKP